MLAGPDPDAAKRRAEAFPERGQPIVHARGDDGMDAARHEPVALELAESFGQHALADAVDALAQAGEAHLFLAFQGIDDEERPAVSDALENLAHELALLGREFANA